MAKKHNPRKDAKGKKPMPNFGNHKDYPGNLPPGTTAGKIGMKKGKMQPKGYPAKKKGHKPKDKA
jgi:hypothetical protein